MCFSPWCGRQELPSDVNFMWFRHQLLGQKYRRDSERKKQKRCDTYADYTRIPITADHTFAPPAWLRSMQVQASFILFWNCAPVPSCKRGPTCTIPRHRYSCCHRCSPCPRNRRWTWHPDRGYPTDTCFLLGT